MFTAQDRVSTITEEHLALYGVTDDASYAASKFITNCDGGENRRAEYFLPSGRTYSLEIQQISQFKQGIIAEVSGGDIYVETTTAPDIYAMNAERVLQNNIYTVYKAKEESIFLSEWDGVGTLNVKKNIVDEFVLLDSSRQVSNDVVELAFLSNYDQEETFYMNLTSSQDAQIAYDILLNNNLVNSGTLSEGVWQIRLDNITLQPGRNLITIQFAEEPVDITISNLHFSKYTEKNKIPYAERAELQVITNAKKTFLRLYTFLHGREVPVKMGSYTSRFFLKQGWHGLENASRWTSESASVQFWSQNKGLIVVEFKAGTYNYSGDTRVFVNDNEIGTIHPPDSYELLIPASVLNPNGIQILRLENDNAVAPCDYSESTDTRILGIRVSEINFKYVE
jgi:hypothetical protein